MTEQAARRFYAEWSIANLGQDWPTFWEWAEPLPVVRGQGGGFAFLNDPNRSPQFLHWHTAFHGSNWDAKAADMTSVQLRDLRADARRARSLLPLAPSRAERPIEPGCIPSGAPSRRDAAGV